MDAESKKGTTLSIKLNPWEENRLLELQQITEQSKSFLLKSSLYSVSPIVLNIACDGFYKIYEALNNQNYTLAKEEAMNTCITLNSLSQKEN